MRSMAKPPCPHSVTRLPQSRPSPLLTSASSTSTAAASTTAVMARLDRSGLCRVRTASIKPAAAAAVAASANLFPPGYRARVLATAVVGMLAQMLALV